MFLFKINPKKLIGPQKMSIKVQGGPIIRRRGTAVMERKQECKGVSIR